MKRIDVIDNFKDFVDDVFNQAIDRNASDIHIEPQKLAMYIRFRIDWEMSYLYEISLNNKDTFLTRVKIMSQLKIDENRLPQDWNIVYNYKDNEDIDMRISTFPTIYGEKICIRILRKSWNLMNIKTLWFLPITLKTIENALKVKEWLVLVSWPTGSWKTTTLYAMLNSFDPKKYNISTLEDPVEYKLEWVNQSQVKPDIWYKFADWLRTLLRQDPDIVLVWEIRDKETAKLAVEASLTWHLVFGTIHSNRWSWVVERIINMWIEPYLVSSALKLIVNQRLVRRLCTCSKNMEYTEHELNMFNDWFKTFPDIWAMYKENLKLKEQNHEWCDKCRTVWKWYAGRAWLHEVTVIDADFSRLILEDLNPERWNALMVKKEYLNIYQDWLMKVISGATDLKQILPYKES
jgi:type IV pilus assembly protein PilB